MNFIVRMALRFGARAGRASVLGRSPGGRRAAGLALLAALLTLGVSGCGAGEERDLLFGDWYVTELDGGSLPGFPANRHPRISFGDEGFSGLGNVAGFGGCNQFGGEFVRRADRLSFRELYATRVYCADLYDFETALLEGLDLVTRYVLDAGTLVLHTEYRELARLEREVPE
jgi:heat shock protein HslJ